MFISCGLCYFFVDFWFTVIGLSVSFWSCTGSAYVQLLFFFFKSLMLSHFLIYFETHILSRHRSLHFLLCFPPPLSSAPALMCHSFVIVSVYPWCIFQFVSKQWESVLRHFWKYLYLPSDFASSLLLLIPLPIIGLIPVYPTSCKMPVSYGPGWY